jgi:hypothetical protein
MAFRLGGNMRGFSLFVAALLSFSPHSQQSPVSTLQGSQSLQKALIALAPNLTLTDVTLSGSVRRIAGSDDESGSAVLKALSSGAARAELSFTSGIRTEIINSSSSLTPGGFWSGFDGVPHPIASHNLLVEPVWFFPAFAISHRLSTGYVATDLGTETHDDISVEHISVSQPAVGKLPSGTPDQQHLSQVDFYFDLNTFLPTALAFNIHPDDNALIDIPVEIHFSDYRSVNGVQIPFHVEKFLNNSLVLDFQAQSTTVNSGISAAEFSIQ